MAKESSTTLVSVLSQTMLSTDLYKPNQGRRVRTITGSVVAGAFILGAYGILVAWTAAGWGGSGTLLALLMCAGGGWLGFRLVCWPTFADFLIATEAEMNKVSWPTETELIRGSVVVLFTMFFLSALLYAYNVLWSFLFRLIGVLPS